MSSNFIITIHYNPGMPKRYAVIGAATWYAAKQAVLREIGYNPGVEISWLTLREGDAADQMIYMRSAS